MMRRNILPTTFQPENGCIRAGLLAGLLARPSLRRSIGWSSRRARQFLTRRAAEAVGAIAGGWPPIRVGVINGGRACWSFPGIGPLGGGAQSGAGICSA